MKELLGHILEKDPKKRYTARQIAEDPWLKGKKN
jgi:serine/threonine protein kinase